MRTNIVGRFVVCAGMFLAPGCSSPVAPPAAPLGPLEPLTAVVTNRFRTAGERLPNVSVFGNAGTVSVQVSRLALCATQVQAGFVRSAGALDVVATVADNPLAICVQNEGQYVVTYILDIPQVSLGRYNVRVFERLRDATPRFVGQSRADVDQLNQ